MCYNRHIRDVKIGNIMATSVAAVNPQQSTSSVGQTPSVGKLEETKNSGKKNLTKKQGSFLKKFAAGMLKQLEAQLKTDESQQKQANENVKKAIHGQY